MLSYYHLLPEILPQVVLALFFFLLLSASGVLTFGRALGTPARGAAVPFLAIPPVEDWIRYLLNCSFKAAWLAALLLWVAFVVVRLAQRRFSLAGLPRLLFSRRWQIVFFSVLFFHIVSRLWLLSGVAPNPRDDLWGGYKANALFNTQGWPAPNPEIPEIGFTYYYFAYTWPAALASWLGISLWAAWWPSIVALSTIGLLLIVELWLPLHSQ
jgi:hypothetical protein